VTGLAALIRHPEKQAALRRLAPWWVSALVMGLGNIVHGQVVKGLLFLAVEVAYLV